MMMMVMVMVMVIVVMIAMNFENKTKYNASDFRPIANIRLLYKICIKHLPS